MPVVPAGGSVTPAPEAPTVLKTCQTPTDGFPGSPTIATGIVTSPACTTDGDVGPDVAVDAWLDGWVVVAVDGSTVAADGTGPVGWGDSLFWHALTPMAKTTRSASEARP